MSIERERLQFEERKFASESEAESKRLAIEQEKLRADISAAKWSRISSALSVVVPLVVAIGTIMYGIWSFGRQAREQAKAQAAEATLQFELKAAEIAFAGKTPEAVVNRAKVLGAVFPNRLADFLKPPKLDPKEVGGGKQDPEGKKFFLELLTKCRPEDKGEIYSLWKALFDDRWLEGVENVLASKRQPGDESNAPVSPVVSGSGKPDEPDGPSSHSPDTPPSGSAT